METSAFAKRLAGNQQTIRDRAIKKLRKFIAAKSAKAGGFSREELLQLWKGLHYSMWMQDKPLLQEDLSEKLCGLLKSFPDTDSALAFSAAFFTTQAREWSRLDSWRMDKFMMLIRDFLRATLELMQRTGWQGKSLEALSAMIGEVMDAAKEDYPDGLRLHLADIYLEEMEKIGAQELTGEQINVMLKPFVKYIVKSRRDTIANQVISKVFMTIVENADSKDEEEEEEEGKLQFDYLGLKKMLFDAGRQKSVLPKIRQKIYKLVKRFSELCGTDSSQETPAPQTPVLGKRKLPDEKENDEEKETPKAKKLKKKKRKLEVTIEVEEEQPPTTTTPPADKSTPQPSASQDIDQALLDWFSQSATSANVRVRVTERLLKQKAEEIAARLGHKNWRCSDGWLARFKARHDIIVVKTTSSSRESGSVGDHHVSTDHWIQNTLEPTLRRYSKRDVFIVKESSLYGKMLPEKTLTFIKEKCCAGGEKKSKERLTFLLFCNSDGSEKLPVFAASKFKKPQRFSGVSSSSPVRCDASEKDLMTSALFRSRLAEFDEKMCAQNRKVLLILTNCSPHDKNPLQLKATELLFLPPAALQRFKRGGIKNEKQEKKKKEKNKKQEKEVSDTGCEGQKKEGYDMGCEKQKKKEKGSDMGCEGQTKKKEGSDMSGEKQKRVDADMEKDDPTLGEKNEGTEQTKGDVKGYDSDVQIIAYEEATEQMFVPTNETWRKKMCKLIGFPTPRSLPERSPQPLREPYRVNTIIGDGNCLYRALSMEICGFQNAHKRVREKIVEFMLKHPNAFSRHIGKDLGEYLNDKVSSPRYIKTWGTDTEISAAATLLQTSIVVFTACSPTCSKWLAYNPLFPLPGTEQSQERVYIRNLGAHFERVVSVKV